MLRLLRLVPLTPMWRQPKDPWHGAPLWALALRDEVRDVGIVLNRRIRMMADAVNKSLDDVLADVQDESTQIDGLSTLTSGIKAQLDAVLAGSLTPAQQAQVNAIFDAVEANKHKVVDAINANTAAAGTPPDGTGASGATDATGATGG
jgi:hypothetical protein